MSKLSEEQFIAEVVARLERSTTDISPQFTTRLDQIRNNALSSTHVQTGIDDEPLVDSVLNTLEDNEHLPPEIEQRLNQIRQSAIARTGSSRNANTASLFDRLREALVDRFATGFPIPASMFATACVMVTVVSLFYVSSQPGGELSLEEELSLLASADDIELYENLDFYLWLAENGIPE